MCLEYREKDTEKLRNENTEEFTFYKVYLIINDILYSATQLTPWGKIEEGKVQEMLSDRDSAELTEEEKRTKIIDYGIHVYIDKKDAYGGIRAATFLSTKYDNIIAIPVRCLKNDLIGAGFNLLGNPKQAVFNKIIINHNDIIKELNKEKLKCV